MKYLSISKVNPKVVEQLEGAHSRVRFEEPSFTHQEQLKEYVDSMRGVDDTMRESKVIQWVTPVLEQTLNLWRSKYSQNSELIKDAQKEKYELENARKQNKTLISTSDSELTSLQEKATEKSDDIDEYKRQSLDTESIDLKSERMKITTLLIFAIIISLGTVVFFANAQISVYWGTMSNAAKVAQVKNFILDGDSTQISAFSDEINLEENKVEDLTMDDLSGIDVSNVYKAPKPTVIQYLAKNPEQIFIILVALLFVMAGKLTAGVYEKMGSPNWMYFLIYILALGVLMGFVFSKVSINSAELQLTTITDQIQAIAIKMKKYENDASGGGYSLIDEKSPKALAMEKEKEKLLSKHQAVQDSFQFFQIISYMLIMLSEVFIGSLAWMGYDEYIKKCMSVRTGSGGLVRLAEGEIEKIGREIDKLLERMKELESINEIATDLIHRLNAMLSDIISREKMDQLAQNYMDRELAFAEQTLQRARNEKL